MNTATALPVSTTKSTKRNRVYIAPKRNPVIVTLFTTEGREATAADLDISPSYALVLCAEGFIEARGTKTTGKPGRPPVLYGLTGKGRDRARRAAKKAGLV